MPTLNLPMLEQLLLPDNQLTGIEKLADSTLTCLDILDLLNKHIVGPITNPHIPQTSKPVLEQQLPNLNRLPDLMATANNPHRGPVHQGHRRLTANPGPPPPLLTKPRQQPHSRHPKPYCLFRRLLITPKPP